MGDKQDKVLVVTCKDNSACGYKHDKVLALTSRIIVLVATSGIIGQVTRACGYKQDERR